MLKESLPGSTTTTIPMETMLKKYYKIRDWNEEGIPSQALLKRLNIPH